MTDDRIFKNKVKEVAELNGLSYTEAKEATITMKKVLDDNSQDENSAIAQYLANSTVDSKSIFPIEHLLKKESFEKCIPIKVLKNTIYSDVDRLKLSSKKKPFFLDFAPLNSKINKVVYSNVKSIQLLKAAEEDVRLSYFSLIKDFGEDKCYFVDKDNFFSQVPKLIKMLEGYEGKEDLLVAILHPLKNEDYMENTHRVNSFDKMLSKLGNLLFTKNFCLISNYPLYCSFEDEIDRYTINEDSKTEILLKDNKISYYPFNKIHGGSHYQSINKTVLGHIQGKPQFNDAHMVLIESNGETCVEEIRKINKADGNVVVGDKDTEFSELRKKMFVKIDYEMTDDELNNFADRIYRHFSQLSLPEAEELIVETPDAERMQMFLDKQQKRYSDKNSMYGEVKIDIEKYTLIDGCLYNENFGEISLYKN